MTGFVETAGGADNIPGTVRAFVGLGCSIAGDDDKDIESPRKCNLRLHPTF